MTSLPPNTRIGFSYGLGIGGLLSKVIRFFTRAECSHVWLLYYDLDFDQQMVMEAHTSWRLIPYSDFCRFNHVVAIFEPSHSIDIGLREGGRLLGSRYDTEGMLGNLVVIVGEWLKRKWKNPFRSKRNVFCSKGVARVMTAAGYPGIPADLDQVRPEHLLSLLNADSSKRVL